MFELGIIILVLSLSVAGLIFWITFAKESLIPFFATVIIASYPFERIPSFEIAGASLRISQIATLVLVGLIVYYGIIHFKEKKPNSLELYKPTLIICFTFLIASIPSIFVVQNFQFYVASIIPLIICMFVIVILPTLDFSILNTTKALFVALAIVVVFSAYQFLGDMINLPIILTGLRPEYTKVVFGIPRIIGTALEPLYLAGMFFLPAMFGLWYIVSTLKHDFGKLQYMNQWIAWLMFLVSSGIIFATLSKAAIAILALIIGGSIIFVLPKISLVESITTLIRKFAGYILLAAILAPIMIPPFLLTTQAITSDIIHHVQETLVGNSATIVQRLVFIEAALLSLPTHAIIGIGAGQYSPEVFSSFPDYIQAASNPRFFVNNVYLEIWLEYGIVALFVFLCAIGLLLFHIYKTLKTLSELDTVESVMIHALFFSLIAYFIQWNTFSPIYIMPIFIQIALALTIIHRVHLKQELTPISQLIQFNVTKQ